MSYILLVIYSIVLLFSIKKMKFFELNGISRNQLILLFGLKFFFGCVLYYIYTYHYTYKNNNDAYKFYYDGITLYNIFEQNPLHYFQLLFGINTDAGYLQKYILGFQYWFLEDGSKVYNDTRTVIRFNSVVYFLSRGNYHVHTLFMCFISFAGLTAIYKIFQTYFSDRKKLLLIAVYLIPSVLFWGSGVLKEGIVLFSMGFMIFFFYRLMNNSFSFKNAFLFLIFCYLVMLSKFYVLFAFMPAIGAGILKKIPYFAKVSVITRYSFVTVLFLLSALIANKTGVYKIVEMLSKKSKDFTNVAWGGAFIKRNIEGDSIRVSYDDSKKMILTSKDTYTLKKGSKYNHFKDGRIVDTLYATTNMDSLSVFVLLVPSNSKINIPYLEPNLWSILKNSPVAFFNSLARPFIWEVNNFLSLFSALENTAFLACFIFALLFFKTPDAEKQEVFFFCLSFVLILFVLIGLTTPVIGAIVRYKIPALPFLLMLLFLVLDVEKIKNKIPFLYNKLIK